MAFQTIRFYIPSVEEMSRQISNKERISTTVADGAVVGKCYNWAMAIVPYPLPEHLFRTTGRKMGCAIQYEDISHGYYTIMNLIRALEEYEV